MQKIIHLRILAAAALCGIAALAFGIYPSATGAGPSALFPNCYLNGSSSASSTARSFMTAGTGTTTLTCIVTAGTETVPDYADLLVQFTASSTGSTLNINTEYSMDGIDWYQNNLSGLATTTPASSIALTQTFTWPFASSTPGLGAVPTNNNRNHKIVRVETPTKYVRILFTLPAGSTNGGVYAELVGRTQTQ